MLKNAQRYPWVTHPGTTATPPNDPLNAYVFASVASIGVDSESGDDLTLTGTGTIDTGKNANAAKWSSSSNLLARGSLVTGSFSACGWCQANTLAGTGVSTVSPFRAVNDITHSIYLNVTDAVTTDGYYDVSIGYQDGGTSDSRSDYVAEDSWFFWAIVCDMGTSLKCRFNADTQTISSSPPNWAGAMSVDINQTSTYAAGVGSYMLTDELYVWDSDLLTDDELDWLYNSGTGRFYPW